MSNPPDQAASQDRPSPWRQFSSASPAETFACGCGGEVARIAAHSDGHGFQSIKPSGFVCCSWGSETPSEVAVRDQEIRLRSLSGRPTLAEIFPSSGTSADTATPARVTALGLVTFLASVVETGGRVELDAGTGDDCAAIECTVFFRGRRPAAFSGISRPSNLPRARVATLREAISGSLNALVHNVESPPRSPRKHLTPAERREAIAELLGDFTVAHPDRELKDLSVLELANWAKGAL